VGHSTHSRRNVYFTCSMSSSTRSSGGTVRDQLKRLEELQQFDAQIQELDKRSKPSSKTASFTE